MRGRYHDIGLVKVDKAFELNAWIRPACLHTEKQLPDTSLYSSGWGVTEFLGDRNQDLLKSKLEVTLVESCNSTYSREIRRQILKDGIVDEYMVCAESRTSISPCQVKKLYVIYLITKNNRGILNKMKNIYSNM